jgi:hypothetical protein
MPLRWVDPTKRIRWRIFAPRLYFEDDVPDRAPDAGWYPR